MRISDWSSDVCSSDLPEALVDHLRIRPLAAHPRPPFGAVQVAVAGLADQRQHPIGTLGKMCPQELLDQRGDLQGRSEERRVGKECVVRVDLGGRRIIKKKNKNREYCVYE